MRALLSRGKKRRLCLISLVVESARRFFYPAFFCGQGIGFLLTRCPQKPRPKKIQNRGSTSFCGFQHATLYGPALIQRHPCQRSAGLHARQRARPRIHTEGRQKKAGGPGVDEAASLTRVGIHAAAFGCAFFRGLKMRRSSLSASPQDGPGSLSARPADPAVGEARRGNPARSARRFSGAAFQLRRRSSGIYSVIAFF